MIILTSDVTVSPRDSNTICVEIDEESVIAALNDRGYFVFTEEQLEEEVESRS